MNLQNKVKRDSLYLKIDERIELIELGKKHLKLRLELNFCDGILTEKIKIIEPIETIKI